MGYFTREQRIGIAMGLLARLKNTPESLDNFTLELNCSRDILARICKRLKTVGLVESVLFQGWKRNESVPYTEESVREALGYAKDQGFKIVQCNFCFKDKKRMFMAQLGGRYDYLDDAGRRWHGKKCPDCYATSNTYYEEKDPEPLTDRKCRDCRRRLPVSRYFNCYECQPDLPSVDEDYMYHGQAADLDMGELDYEID